MEEAMLRELEERVADLERLVVRLLDAEEERRERHQRLHDEEEERRA